MEDDHENIIDSLNALNYASVPLDKDALKSIIESDLIEYSKLIAKISKELSRLGQLDEHVNPIDNLKDESSFYLEICGFLRELSCPYKNLVDASVPINERFKNSESKRALLDFLLTELQAARIIRADKPQAIEEALRGAKQEESSEEAKALRRILMTLGFPKPPTNVTIEEIWSKIETKLADLLKNKLPKDHLGNPLLSTEVELDEKQWLALSKLNQALCDDFQMRRELLLTRLDVTIQSFKWADRLKQSNGEIANIYQQRRKELSTRQNVKVYEILAARDDLCKQERTCSTRVMTKTKLHKILMPKVPDRGGRTCELQPPPPDMPAFQQRRSSNHHAAQPQRQQQQRFDNNSNRWANDNRQQQQQHRPKSDFDRFQDQDYHGGGGRGGFGGGYHRGGRGGGGRGNRGGGGYY